MEVQKVYPQLDWYVANHKGLKPMTWIESRCLFIPIFSTLNLLWGIQIYLCCLPPATCKLEDVNKQINTHGVVEKRDLSGKIECTDINIVHVLKDNHIESGCSLTKMGVIAPTFKRLVLSWQKYFLQFLTSFRLF